MMLLGRMERGQGAALVLAQVAWLTLSGGVECGWMGWGDVPGNVLGSARLVVDVAFGGGP